MYRYTGVFLIGFGRLLLQPDYLDVECAQVMTWVTGDGLIEGEGGRNVNVTEILPRFILKSLHTNLFMELPETAP